MNLQLLPLVEAKTAEGPWLKLAAPISFWGGVDPKTGMIIDARHPDNGTCITGTILVMPGTIGSSSASAVLLELVRARIAPAAILMPEPDAILLIGLIVAREMGWPTPPAWQYQNSAMQLPGSGHAVIDEAGRLTFRTPA
jgi:uncharacterized protein